MPDAWFRGGAFPALDWLNVGTCACSGGFNPQGNLTGTLPQVAGGALRNLRARSCPEPCARWRKVQDRILCSPGSSCACSGARQLFYPLRHAWKPLQQCNCPMKFAGVDMLYDLSAGTYKLPVCFMHIYVITLALPSIVRVVGGSFSGSKASTLLGSCRQTTL